MTRPGCSNMSTCWKANLVFRNGVTLPLVSEFLSHGEGDPDDQKQDSEQRAFHRLAKRLKDYFPRLPMLVLLDGLYPKRPDHGAPVVTMAGSS